MLFVKTCGMGGTAKTVGHASQIITPRRRGVGREWTSSSQIRVHSRQYLLKCFASANDCLPKGNKIPDPCRPIVLSSPKTGLAGSSRPFLRFRIELKASRSDYASPPLLRSAHQLVSDPRRRAYTGEREDGASVPDQPPSMRLPPRPHA